MSKSLCGPHGDGSSGSGGHRDRRNAWSRPAAVLLAAVLAAPLSAVQDLTGVERSIEFHVYPLTCVPKEDNSVVYADVGGMRLGESVRLYFRRLHQVTEDFYYVPMEAVRQGRYAGVLPKPRDRKLEKTELERRRDERSTDDAWAAWWQEKDASHERNPNGDLDDDRIERVATAGGIEEPGQRKWMHDLGSEALQDWLESLKNEPAEFYVAVYDPSDTLVKRTGFLRTQVTPDCPEMDPESVRQTIPEAWEPELGDDGAQLLTHRILGRTRVLTIGETANWQHGEGVFHWKCDGIVTRIDPGGIYRPDEVCRACVFIMPLWLVGLSAVPGAAAVIDILPDEPASQSSP